MTSAENNTGRAVFPESVVIARLRADMYRLLAIGFADPTRELARGLIDSGFQMDAKAILTCLKVAGHTMDELAELLGGLTESIHEKDPETYYHDLNISYAHLFIGPGPVAAPPYESLHDAEVATEPVVLMVGPVASATLKAYRKAGLAMAKDFNEPPDHISTELEFMYFLCSEEAVAREAQDEAAAAMWRNHQQAFLRDHLGKWAASFFGRVKQVSRDRFYAVLSDVAIAFLYWDTGASGA